MLDQVLALAVPNVDAFAEEVGVTRFTLYHWRRGTRNPTPENILALADALERRGGELVELAERLRREAGK